MYCASCNKLVLRYKHKIQLSRKQTENEVHGSYLEL